MISYAFIKLTIYDNDPTKLNTEGLKLLLKKNKYFFLICKLNLPWTLRVIRVKDSFTFFQIGIIKKYF